MSTLSGPPATPTTVAPSALASWTKSEPRPPAAAVTSTTSSAVMAAASRIPNAVRPVPIMATATSSSIPDGISCNADTDARANSA